MKPALSLLLFLLFCPAPGAAQDGNLAGQEVADVVYRKLDWPLGYFNDHVAIYLGQTYKEGQPSNMPLFHEVIQMAGVTSGGSKFSMWVDDEGFHVGKMVTEVERIGFDNFHEFQRAHPHYYGAFTLQEGITLDKKKRILDWAQAMRNRGSADGKRPIDYVVMPGESAAKMLVNYFKTNQDLSAYGDNIEVDDIDRLRCDSFVEYAYAAAGVPIARGNIGQSLNLKRRYDAVALVDMAAGMQLYPSNQRGWLTTTGIDQPQLTAKDSSGNPITSETAPGTISFNISDAGSGAGLLKIHKEPYDSEYGREDFTPFVSELLMGSAIQTGNIQQSTSAPFSIEGGLSPGYFTATAYDHAGNSSQQFNFKISELSAININSANALYNNFRGISATAPSTLERSHTFDFSEPVAGVSAVSIDGPQGNLWSRTFDPPVFSTSTSLTDLPVGNYTAQSFNSVGGETLTPFKISELNIQISTLESTQNYVHDDLLKPGTFYFTAHIIAKSPNDLSRIQLITSTGALLAEKIVTGYSATADFDLPAFPLSQPLPNHSLFDRYIWMDVSPPPYVARVIDSDGNVKDSLFALSGKETYLAAGGEYPEGIESYDYIRSTDVTKSDFIAGPLVMNYGISGSTSGLVLGTGEGFGAGWASVSEWTTQTPISISEQLAIPMPQTIGTFREIIRTRGSDGIVGSESVVVEGEVFIDRYDSNGTSEEWIRSHASCGTAALVLGYWPAAGFVVCTRQTAPAPILQPAKQYVEWEFIYNKTSDTTIPMCGLIPDGTNLNYQCQRYGAKVLSYSQTPILAGFALSQEPILNIARIPSGQNIFAPLNSYGEAYFDEVTSPGSLTVTATTSRPPAGFAEAAQNTTYEMFCLV